MDDLFSNLGGSCLNFERPKMTDADLMFYPTLFNQKEASDYLVDLIKNIKWKQESIKIYGKEHNLPRLTSWYGDPNIKYSYSGIVVDSNPWIEPLISIKKRIEEISNCRFNSVLLNRYRDGNDSVSWHSDDEEELGINPIIGSVSFGESRTFAMKHKEKNKKQKFILNSGSFLLMRGDTQSHWLHQIPKSKKVMSERVNLTFRVIKS